MALFFNAPFSGQKSAKCFVYEIYIEMIERSHNSQIYITKFSQICHNLFLNPQRLQGMNVQDAFCRYMKCITGCEYDIM